MLTPPIDPQTYPWPSGWQAIAPGDEEECAFAFGFIETCGRNETPATTFVDELRREMPPGHLLYGRKFIAIACSTRDPDDVLFYTNDPQRPFAYVHLTWHLEKAPLFPFAKSYETLNGLLAECSCDD